MTEYLYGELVAMGVDDFTLLGDVYNPMLGMAPPDSALVFVDNHISQRTNDSGVCVCVCVFT